MKKYTMLFLFLFFNCLNYSNTFETNKKFKNSIINNKFSEHIEGFRGRIDGNGNNYKNINSIKVYEVVGDAYYNSDFFCTNTPLIKATSIEENYYSIFIREIKNMINLNLTTNHSEEVKKKIEMINKKIRLHIDFIRDYLLMRFYNPREKVSCHYSSNFIIYSTNEFSFLLNLDNIKNYEIELKKKYDLEKELNILNQLVEYLYKDNNYDKIKVGMRNVDEFIHYDRYKNAQRKVDYKNLDQSDINDIVRIYRYDKKDIYEYSIYLDLLELSYLIKNRE